LAVTVTLNADPAVALLGALTTNREAAAAFTLTEVLPVMELATVSVAVMV
jgi:hypothetical protein